MKAGATGAGAVFAATLVACAAVPQAEPRVAASEREAALIALGRDGFAQCDGCHTVQPGGRSAAGPNLAGVVGRSAGSLTGYPFSDALAGSDVVWDAASLDAFLADPSGYVPGSEMRRGMVRDPEMRAAIVAYLASLSQ